MLHESQVSVLKQEVPYYYPTGTCVPRKEVRYHIDDKW
jgi:hypothetical protein